MLNRRHVVAGLTLSAVVMLGPTAQAWTKRPFDAKAFEAAQAAGKPILIEVSAPWCPICKAQKPILATLSSKPKFKDFAFFEIDFDSQKDLLRRFNVQRQSTLIVFKGKQEAGRSTGDRNPASIEALVDKGV